MAAKKTPKPKPLPPEEKEKQAAEAERAKQASKPDPKYQGDTKNRAPYAQ